MHRVTVKGPRPTSSRADPLPSTTAGRVA
jgi:hypothetical protein